MKTLVRLPRLPRLPRLAAVLAIATVLLAGCGGPGTSSGKTTITYWQYNFPTKVTAIDHLIAQFEQQNPNITVQQQTFPYDAYTQKVTAAMFAHRGPDVMNLYYGWIPEYVSRGFLQPLPQGFMSTQQIQSYFVPMVQDSEYNGAYYTVPIAVRSLALFWNKDLFQKAGLDPNTPPKTWDELTQDAQKLTIRDSSGKLQQEGFAWNVSGQGYHTFEEVLLREWGVTPFSADGKQVLWTSSPDGLAAFTYWMDMPLVEKIGDPNFLTGYNTAFEAGKAGIMVDGSFDIAALKKAAKFNWGVATLPVKTVGGVQSNFGSFWVNGVAKGVSGAKLQASEKFLKFLISPSSERYWLNAVGELPAAASLSSDQQIANDPVYGPFVQGLTYAHATDFVDEAKERQALIDGTNKILLENAPIPQAFDSIVQQEQSIRDQYFSSHT